MGDGRIGSEGAWTMERQKIINDLRRLAGSKSNDAVKLAFLTQEDADRIDQLDLRGLVERSHQVWKEETPWRSY